MSGAELEEVSQVNKHRKLEVTLLDLYSGCGAMSTGLCLGANLSSLNLVTVSSLFLLSNSEKHTSHHCCCYCFILVVFSANKLCPFICSFRNGLLT